ncbi:microtubule-associated proteins 1A/1B light chain 3B-like isoform X2 [Harmonia axyridis]|uniref:microtubule-associated proteins 1A/1B light chain 3B-like isoform X2 n=1 Tax=Harmonia axyridis TaxID=115357 RepID=UPI001E275087|nr:microtubule-associated proteins 1A/1B light chain 3B-like isoform X2 [Harmonia axyridis]
MSEMNELSQSSGYASDCSEESDVAEDEILAMRSIYPTKIPVIVKRFSKEKHLPQLDKKKYLIPQEVTMSQFQMILRNKMQLQSNRSMYLLVNNRSMLSLSTTIAEVYYEYAQNEGYLSIAYASEEVFGSRSSDSIEKSSNTKIKY